MSSDVFRIVFVCTGNRFRSPLAETFFRHSVGDIPVWTTSLGTRELSNKGALPEALAEAASRGLDLVEHKAQPLTGENLSSVDLVVGFERAHVVMAVVDAHAPRDRSFTLPELVELLEVGRPASADTQLERARQAIDAASSARPDANLLSVPEIGDPLGASPEIFRDTAAEIEQLVRRLVATLFRSPPPS